MDAAGGQGRFIPDLQPFKATLLAFDFYEDIVDDQKLEKKMTAVPDYFEDEHQYVSIFQPLYWEEVKSQLHRAKHAEMAKETELLHLARFRLEKPFIKLEFSRQKEEATRTLYAGNDLILLSKGKDPRKKEEVHCLALVDRSLGNNFEVTVLYDESARFRAVARMITEREPWNCAKVISVQTMVREYEGLMSFPKIPLRHIIVNRDEAGRSAETGTEMQAAPKMANAEERDPDDTKFFSIPKELEAKLQASYNPSQMKAISDSRKIAGITLVQGPPGTGKTATVLGILAALVNARATEARAVSYTRTGVKRKSPEDTGDGSSDDGVEDEDTLSRLQREEEARSKARLLKIRSRMPWSREGFTPWSVLSEKEVVSPGDKELVIPFLKLRPADVVPMSEIPLDAAPKKVLVCAPSNAAVDEVLHRTAAEGVRDEHGECKRRTLVRLGPNFSRELEQHSFERIVKKRLMAKTDMPDLNQQEVEKERLMREAAILFSTLSISGSRDVVGFPGDFDTIVLDEASQGLEISILVPLKLGCRRLIMVGDPKQLPATCFSEVAKKHVYERSLFQRLQETNYKVSMLQTQYRMHPHISVFPSQRFYDGMVQDALDQAAFEQKFPAPWSSIPCFSPVVFFDLQGAMDKSQTSFVNFEEADFIIELFTKFKAMYPGENWRERLGVISPYKEQVHLIKQKFRELYMLAPKQPCPVDVNTVDGFQGREKDIIIVSVVRSESGQAGEHVSIGFVKDRRRMNVAFTRPRRSLWVVGHAKVLQRNKDWKAFIDQQRQHCRMLRTSKPFPNWLGRYLRSWFDRHPDLPRPAESILGPPAEGTPIEEPQEPETIPAEELEERRREEEQEAAYLRPDIEEASSDSESLGSEPADAGSDVEGGQGRVGAGGGVELAQEQAPTARRQPAAGEEEGPEGEGEGE